MHPSTSVIFFTVASGAGYGLLFALGLAALAGALAGSGGLALSALVLAFVLITAGLLSSTFHLGHPERAWRALTQWRSSWLSREGAAAVLTYIPMVGLFLAFVLGITTGAWVAALGGLAMLGALATVWCTGKIYAVLKPVREWHTPWTAPGYLAFAAATGFTLAEALALGFGRGDLGLAGAGLALLGILSALVAHRKRRAWLLDNQGNTTRETATGLAGRGTVRPFEEPHTGTNYLLSEMGYVLGRRHRVRLSALMVAFAFAVPLLLVVTAALTPLGVVPAAFAVLAVLAGTAIERWLFFATATHTVTLYYR
jgi:DMSO reductase anchor subunit